MICCRHDSLNTWSGGNVAFLFQKMPDAKLPAVPETILKRRKRQAENRANRAKLAVKAKVDKRRKRVETFKRAEKYAKEYQDQERDEIR